MKAEQLTSLSLEGIHNIKRGNSLALGMFGICDGISDNAFKEGLQNTSSLLVDHYDIALEMNIPRRSVKPYSLRYV